MQTPKALAKSRVDRALSRPALRLRIERYVQVPGTVHRSREVLFPMEKTYRNVSFAPYWYFGGFREVALGAMLSHEVLSPFRLDVDGAFQDFLSSHAAILTVEQARLRTLQDDVRRRLQSRIHGNRRRLELEHVNTRIFERLQAIRGEKRSEVRRVPRVRG